VLVGVFDREAFRSSRGQQIGGGDTRGGGQLVDDELLFVASLLDDNRADRLTACQ
jgi:hypothetical protein